MAEHFIRATKVQRDQLLKLDGSNTVERSSALRASIAASAPAAEYLFAEPHIRETGPDQLSVSWYADAAGEAMPLATLDGGARSAAEKALADQLSSLRPLLDDSGLGRLLSQALYINSLDDIFVIGDQPVLTNWGLLPDGVVSDPTARKAHFTNTLGRFVALPMIPPITETEQSEWQLSERSPPAITAAPVNPAPETAIHDPTIVAAPPAEARVQRGWIPLLVLLGLAAAIAAYLLWPGTRLFPSAQTVIGDEDATGMAQEANRALEERIQELRDAIAGGQCRADGVLILPDGRTPYGLLPPDEGATTQERAERQSPGLSDSLLPPAPDQIMLPAMPDAEAGSLLAALQAGTVLVAANGDQGGEIGSGFFIDDTHIVTNHHVISGAGASAQIYVTSPVLGEMRPARLLAMSGPFQENGDDFALLEVDGSGASPLGLRISATPLTLQNVVAAGYPGDVMMTDTAFGRLLEGEPTAVPGLTVTDGIVNTEQRFPPDVQIVIHSAPISQGNSGGPLTDMCGRVVGVNTFVRTGELRNLNVAMNTRDLVEFLASAGLNAETTSEDCIPTVAARPARPNGQAQSAPDGEAMEEGSEE